MLSVFFLGFQLSKVECPFFRAFAGATVHDMFNFLSVLILLPLEVWTGYLEKLTTKIVATTDLQQGNGGPELLDVSLYIYRSVISETNAHNKLFSQAITDPLTDHVIQVNKTIITMTAQEIPIEDDASMVKVSRTFDC